MMHGIYIGLRPELTGKGALLRQGSPNQLLAQFDDTTTGLGFGWHAFSSEEFEIERSDK